MQLSSQPKENAVEAMSLARSGSLKSAADVRKVAAWRYSFNSAAAVINTLNDDGGHHAQLLR